MDVQNLVLEIVRDNPGISGVRLISDVIHSLYKSKVSIPNVDLLETIDQMVEEDLIVEVEYTTPLQEYRVKSLYFPAGTTVRCLSRSCNKIT